MGVMTFFAAATLVLLVFVRMIQYADMNPIYNGAVMVCLLTLFGLLANVDSWWHELKTKAQNINPGVPLTRANIVDLPAPDSLVRASTEPVQEQQAVLLRAATDTQEWQVEQLVRASAGGKEQG